MTEPLLITAAAALPPHTGSGPLTPAQMRGARVRTALRDLTICIEDLEDVPPVVRQAACQPLKAVLDLQGLLQTQRHIDAQEQRHGEAV
jgi:hypothetical protein